MLHLSQNVLGFFCPSCTPLSRLVNRETKVILKSCFVCVFGKADVELGNRN